MLFTTRIEVHHHVDIGQPTLDLLRKLIDQSSDRTTAVELTAALGAKTAALTQALSPKPQP